MYAIHAPLDVGRRICVSKSLGQEIGLRDPELFFPACGGYLGVFGRTMADSLQGIARDVGRGIGLDTVDLFDNGGEVGMTAVVAGGGDQTEILKVAAVRPTSPEQLSTGGQECRTQMRISTRSPARQG